MSIKSLDIIKAAPQHMDLIGSTGYAMLCAITAQWDYIGSTRPVRWSNSMLSARCGVDRHHINAVRKRLIDHGWITYDAQGQNIAGHYTPHIPSYHVSTDSGTDLIAEADWHKSTNEGANGLANTPPIKVPMDTPSEANLYTCPNPNPILEKAAERPKIKIPVRNNPPSLEQVAEYIQKQGYSLSPEDFHDGNTRGGWTYGMGGKSLVYDWKAHVRTWEAWKKKNNPPPPPTPPRPKAPPINLDFT